MMTTMQINQINLFIRESGIRYYDLEQEIADHMAEWMNADIRQHKCSFEDSFSRLQVHFPASELKKIQRSSRKYLLKKYFSMLFKEWRTFLTWPGMIKTVGFIILMMLSSGILGDAFFRFFVEHIQLWIIMLAALYFQMNEKYKLDMRNDINRKILSLNVAYRVFILVASPFILTFLSTSLYLIYMDSDGLTAGFYKVSTYIFIIQLPFIWTARNSLLNARQKINIDFPQA